MNTNKKGSGFANASFVINQYRTGESSEAQIYEYFVPLDYMKAQLINIQPSMLLNNNLLSFGRLINEDTGEIIQEFDENNKKRKPFRLAKYQNLVFKYYPDSGYTLIMGSLHKFSNDGLHNHNTFTISEFNNVLIKLYNLFGILPQNLKITQLEWAVNIHFEMVNEIIDHCIFYKGKIFSEPLGNKGARYRQVKLTEYYLKVYNKGLHFLLGFDILRFERKQKDWTKFCKHHEIGSTLLDLINSGFKGLKETLCENWLDIIFFDPKIPESNTLILQYRDPKKWQYFQKTSRANRKKHRDKLRDANQEHGQNIQVKVYNEIINKINDLNTERLTIPNFKYIPNTLTPIIFIHYGIEDLFLSA